MTDPEPLPESNPFVDIATHLFLEDLAEKVGTPGLNNYLISLANNLARSMPEEEYDTWDGFLDALRSGHSILAAFERLDPVTDHCIVTRRSPFERGWREYAKRVGSFSKVHREVAEYYNEKVQPTAVNSLHIVLQTFRAAAVERIRVAGKPVRYAQVATVWVDGEKKVVPDAERDALLRIAGISTTKLGMLLRNNADVWVLYPD